MYKIGVTGGIGSGKTTASNFFKSKGAFIFNADKEAKKHLKSSLALQHTLISAFGEKVTDSNKLNLAKLADIAFSNKLDQDILNGIMWPEVYMIVQQSLDHAESKGFGIFIVDAAMIFEARFDNIFDTTILISTKKDIRIKRAINRQNLPLEQIQNRMSLQMSENKKRKLADYVINNDGSKKVFAKKLESFFTKNIMPHVH